MARASCPVDTSTGVIWPPSSDRKLTTSESCRTASTMPAAVTRIMDPNATGCGSRP